MPGGSDGIQKLLAAEQEAQRIVSEARKGAAGLGNALGSCPSPARPPPSLPANPTDCMLMSSALCP